MALHPARGGLLYTGKAKEVYASADPDLLWIRFTDGATAFNGIKRATIADKGRINARISARIFRRLEAAGVPTHLVDELGEDLHLVHRVEIIPVEVVVRNRAAGSLCKRLGIAEGAALPAPLIEFFFKSDALQDPLITDDHALVFGWARAWELAYLRDAALRVNAELRALWAGLGVDLIDFKMEFGRALAPSRRGQILLADEITPDGSRLWDQATGRSLDKDVFRKDQGDLSQTYRELLARLEAGGATRP